MAILGRRVLPPQPDRCPSTTVRNLGFLPRSLSLLPYSPCQIDVFSPCIVTESSFEDMGAFNDATAEPAV